MRMRWVKEQGSIKMDYRCVSRSRSEVRSAKCRATTGQKIPRFASDSYVVNLGLSEKKNIPGKWKTRMRTKAMTSDQRSIHRPRA